MLSRIRAFSLLTRQVKTKRKGRHQNETARLYFVPLQIERILQCAMHICLSKCAWRFLSSKLERRVPDFEILPPHWPCILPLNLKGQYRISTYPEAKFSFRINPANSAELEGSMGNLSIQHYTAICPISIPQVVAYSLPFSRRSTRSRIIFNTWLFKLFFISESSAYILVLILNHYFILLFIFYTFFYFQELFDTRLF